MELERYLEDLEARLIPEQEDAVLEAWRQWAYHENTKGPFAGLPRRKMPAKLPWPEISVNQALRDADCMLLSQFYRVHRALEEGSAATLSVRANYGIGNVATMFGAELFVMDEGLNTLPNVRALGPEKALAFAAGKRPNPDAGNGEAIWRMARRFAEIRSRYPRLAKYVRIEQPDLQGPMDNCELLIGSGIFYLLYDEPEAVHALLKVVTDLLDQCISRWKALFPREDGTCSYFRHVEKGGIAIRDDSGMNLSPDFFREFIAPYDGFLLKKHGGIVHFCGRGDHYIDILSHLEGLNGVNMSQPHLNDMNRILSATADRGINLSISAPEIDLSGHDAARVVFLP